MSTVQRRSGPIVYRAVFVCSSTIVLAACASTSEMEREEALNSVVAAEREFAAAAAEHGVNQAFLANLTDDAVLFRPRPVIGVEYLRSAPSVSGALTWDPEFADVSSDGRLGYTTGPWMYRPDKEGADVTTGRYLTFWRRGPDGKWKAVIDHGIAGPIADDAIVAAAPVEAPTTIPNLPTGFDLSAAHRDLVAADSAVSAALDDPARLRQIATDTRILRNGFEPRFGIGALASGAIDGAARFRTIGAAVAPESGDLGYTYGEYAIVPPDSAAPSRAGTYLRGWRHDGEGWELVVDLMTPLQAGA